MKSYLILSALVSTLTLAQQSFANDICGRTLRFVSSDNSFLHRHPHNNSVGGWGNVHNSAHYLAENSWKVICVEPHEGIRGTVMRLASNNGTLLHHHPHNNSVGAWGHIRDTNTHLPQNLWRLEATDDLGTICDAKVRLLSDNNAMLHRHPHNNSVGVWGHYYTMSSRLPENEWTVLCD